MAFRHGSLKPPVGGDAFPGGSSRKLPAELILREGDLVELIGADGQVLSSASLGALKPDPPLGDMPRRLAFPDGAMFESTDHEGFTRVFGSDRWNDLHGWEAFRPRLVGVVLAAVFAGFLVWRYGLDILVSAAIALTPQPVIDQIDAGSVQTMDFMIAKDTKLDEDRRNQAREVFENIRKALPDDIAKEFDFELIFRDMPGLGPNAAALPGGTVIVTDEFLKEFPDDDVLAAVLGHEIGHVVEQHGLRQMYRSLGTFFLVTMLIGDPGPLLDEILLEGNALLALSYSRKHERAADAFGLRLTLDAGYNPGALRVFFETIAKKYGDNSGWMSSHPSNSERIRSINSFVEENT